MCRRPAVSTISRSASDAFAFPFAKLSNYISPTAPAARLAVEELGDGKVRALPLEEQPETIRFIVKRANTQKSVDLFAELVAAEDEVAKQTRRSRFEKRAQIAGGVILILLGLRILLEHLGIWA